MKLPKLNQKGIAHILAPILFIAIFAGIGGIVLLKSHAQTPASNTTSTLCRRPTSDLLYSNGGDYGFIYKGGSVYCGRTSLGSKLGSGVVGYNATFGNSGSTIYYTDGSGVYSVDSGATTFSTLVKTYVKQIRRSDSAAAIAYTEYLNPSDLNSNNALNVRGDNSGTKLIYKTPGCINNFQWSPDGKKILLEMTIKAANFPGCGAPSLYTVNSDGTGLTKIVSYETGSGWAPTIGTGNSWSPLSSRVTYSLGPALHVIGVTTKADKMIYKLTDTSRIIDFAGPVWSPDGSHIAYSTISNKGGYAKLNYVTPSGTGFTTLATLTGSLEGSQGIDWSPDSLNLADSYNIGNGPGGTISIYPLSGGVTQLATSSTHQMSAPEWSEQ